MTNLETRSYYDKQEPISYNPEDLTNVQAFINSPGVILSVNAKETACVDPRPVLPVQELRNPDTLQRQHDTVSAVRRPGGDFGYVLAVLAANPTIDEITAVNLVYFWKDSFGGSFSMHEDTMALLKKGQLAFGCGFADKASLKENEELFGLDHNRVIKAKQAVIWLTNNNQKLSNVVRAPILGGIHNENSVFVVNSHNKTINPVGPGINGFRYDAALDINNLKSLVVFSRRTDVNVRLDFDKLLAASDRQTEATLLLLAKNMPVYEVDMMTNQPRVNFLYRVLPKDFS